MLSNQQSHPPSVNPHIQKQKEDLKQERTKKEEITTEEKTDKEKEENFGNNRVI